MGTLVVEEVVLGGAGRRDGGDLDGAGLIWFLRGLPWRTGTAGFGGRACGAKMGDSFFSGAGGVGAAFGGAGDGAAGAGAGVGAGGEGA